MSSNEEMKALIAQQDDTELIKAYGEMHDLSVAHPELRQWYAAWFIYLADKRIGDVCFKGLSSGGSVEIGYGLLPEFWGNGYATEAVMAMTEWASKQPGVKFIEAEAEDSNIASKRVLEKAGYVPTGKIGEEGPRFLWHKPADS